MKEKGKCGFIFWSWTSEDEDMLVTLKLEYCVKTEALNRGLKKGHIKRVKKVPWLHCSFSLPNKVWELGYFL